MKISNKDKRAQRNRTKLKSVSNGKPRLSIFRSNKNIYAQIIDDVSHKTIANASTQSKELVKEKLACNTASAKKVGQLIAQKASQNKIENVVFDRGSYLYHGVVKSFAEGARKAGLKF